MSYNFHYEGYGPDNAFPSGPWITGIQFKDRQNFQCQKCHNGIIQSPRYTLSWQFDGREGKLKHLCYFCARELANRQKEFQQYIDPHYAKSNSQEALKTLLTHETKGYEHHAKHYRHPNKATGTNPRNKRFAYDDMINDLKHYYTQKAKKKGYYDSFNMTDMQSALPDLNNNNSSKRHYKYDRQDNYK